MKMLGLLRIPASMIVVMLHSGDALARGGRVGRLICESVACANPIFGSLAIGMGLLLAAGPFMPRLWAFLNERADGTMDSAGPAWKVASIAGGGALAAFGVWVF